MALVILNVDDVGSVAKKIEEATSEVLSAISHALAEEALDLIKQGFADGKNPSGNKWVANLKGSLPLRDTGRLKNSWRVQNVSGNGFVVGSAAAYAIYHQEGTGIHGPKGKPIRPTTKKALSFSIGGQHFIRGSVAGCPIRRMVPDRTIPPRWQIAFDSAANEAFEAFFQ